MKPYFSMMAAGLFAIGCGDSEELEMPVKQVDPVAKFRTQADGGDVNAQHELAVRYHHGKEVVRDEEAAMKWYLKAAKNGSADAAFDLAVMYAVGQMVEKDAAQALKWYRMAAERGHDDAQLQTGLIYLNGSGVAKDEAEAVKWFRKAAAQGNIYAQKNLEEMSDSRK